MAQTRQPVVVLPKISNPQDYVSVPEDDTVGYVLDGVDDLGELQYEVEFRDRRTKQVSFEELLALPNGNKALQLFAAPSEATTSEQGADVEQDQESSLGSSENEEDQVQDMAPTSDDSLSEASAMPRRTTRRLVQTAKSTTRNQHDAVSKDELFSSEDERRKRRRTTRTTAVNASRRTTRNSAKNPELIYLVDEDEDDASSSDDEFSLLKSDTRPRTRRQKSPGGRQFPPLPRNALLRHSERSTRARANMREVEIGAIFRDDSDAPRSLPKAVGARESFQPLPLGNKFHLRHCQQCDSCGKWGGGARGQLIHCQSCTLSYHQLCLGPRTAREHLVTKIGEAEFVLQCRRCCSIAKVKESTAPEQGMCQYCREISPSARPFRKRKTASQEERDRENNDGDDPITEVDKSLINNANNVLFRCVSCWRAFHMHHLRSRSDYPSMDDDDEARIADERFREHSGDFLCIDCVGMKAKPSGLVAWRPINADLYIAGADVQEVDEDLKEYLVKWEAMSHYQCDWMSGAWVWGVASSVTRRAFFKRASAPTMHTEDAIPEDYLRIDIILDVKFTSIVEIRAEEVDKARIREVDKALIKFKGLGYEDAVWEHVPKPEDGDRWTDFVKAYDDWVMGNYIKCPKTSAVQKRLDKVHATEFTLLEKKQQPEKLIGGELMKYQLEGVNWLYYRWWKRCNAILADEMGLGKTIQIIGFFATMVFDHGCFPFLVVVPNGTVPNWRREIKQWAPALRTVTYHGSAQARSMALKYEMYPDGAKELRCHVVIMSYEAAADDKSLKYLRGVQWQGLVVDEGQRLKSDKTQLYGILSGLRIPFRLLLTGTPLQNNARELFNLLQFLDKNFDAAALELEYTELTRDNVPQLHDLIRPFFLRRTKAQVLTFLPPMAQIVLPVSMSALQSKLYASILSKNTDLIKALFDTAGKPTSKPDKANLNNILIQLRKCLCHPFAYNKEIEEISNEAAVSHRNLVEASAKLQLLDILLPKLKERGHRVLIFSQFLSMLDIAEDFLSGLALEYERLDGSISSMMKQKKIDAFNAPDSSLFAFLLSTRAGGVGINLATADTVIILDPDFNPFQDIQAISRAHRIGQKNKVLCFQLMTRASVEEKIVQIGRRKMALDHILIEQMDLEDEGAGVDVESILRLGAADILEGKNQEIRYDSASIDKLLDRSQFEETKGAEEHSAESNFSYARVWANDAESLADSLGSGDEAETAPDPGVWDRILREREKAAAQDAAKRQQVLGRGQRRAKQNVAYNTIGDKPIVDSESDSSDTDFQAEDKKSDVDSDFDMVDTEIDPAELAQVRIPQATGSQDMRPGLASNKTRPAPIVSGPVVSVSESTTAPVSAGAVPAGARPAMTAPETTHPRAADRSVAPPPSTAADTASTGPPSTLGEFHRIRIRWPTVAELAAESEPLAQCYVCQTPHRLGHCPLKLAGVEYCNLCHIAHFGVARSCPHIRSETQVREMLAALANSPEHPVVIEAAKRYLKGVKGTLVQDKKRKAERAEYEAALRDPGQRSEAAGASHGSVRPRNKIHGMPLPPAAPDQQDRGQSQTAAALEQSRSYAQVKQMYAHANALTQADASPGARDGWQHKSSVSMPGGGTFTKFKEV